MTMKSRRRSAVATAAALSIAGLVSPVTALGAPTAPAATTPAPAAAGDTLIISEYIEGSSNNKALEIYNGTGADVDLAGYRLEVFFNGSSTSLNLDLTGTITAGDVFVFAHSSAAPEILAVADQTTGAGLWNGDDALVLRGADSQVVDSLGQVGFDPGTQWGSGLVSTEDNTLRRQADVCSGDTDPTDVFDPGSSWDGFATDTFDGLGAHTADCGPTEPLSPVINEFSVSTAGDDVEFLEVYGEAGTEYSYLSILQVEGDVASSSLGTVVTADGVGTTDAAGLWAVNLPTGRIQNGTLTLLLVEGYTDQHVVDADKDGALDEGTGLTVIDSVAIDDGGAGDLTYSDTVLANGYDGVNFVPGGASRIPDGTDTDTTADWVRNAFNKAGVEDGLTPAPGEAWNTPGAPNEVYEEEPPPPGGVCGDPAMAIGTVQGDGDATPIPGPVTIEGVVVGDFQTGGFNGFYLQDSGDDNPATSDGIFVYAPSGTDVSVGNQLRVTGTAGEYEGKTQISGSPAVLVCESQVELPEATVLEFPLTDGDQESVEGMRVTFPATLSILEYFN
ncbi:MAG TPA: lamin tail domain-containing protein, partial [Ornithinicoccus sp.]|nr:lamin tail domain-containing protein [Ornithinicoccus sp.]